MASRAIRLEMYDIRTGVIGRWRRADWTLCSGNAPPRELTHTCKPTTPAPKICTESTNFPRQCSLAFTEGPPYLNHPCSPPRWGTSTSGPAAIRPLTPLFQASLSQTEQVSTINRKKIIAQVHTHDDFILRLNSKSELTTRYMVQ